MNDTYIKHQTSYVNGRSSIATVISQLLIFNRAKFGSTFSSMVRHNVERQIPLPTCLGLMLHASTSKRDLVEKWEYPYHTTIHNIRNVQPK